MRYLPMATRDDRKPVGDGYGSLSAVAVPQPLAGNKHTSVTTARSSGKCSLPYFLLSALTTGQIFLLSLFLLWTVKTCYTKYQRIYIVYQVDAQPHSLQNASHHHGNGNRLSNNLNRSLSTLGSNDEEASTHNKLRVNAFPNFTIVGSTSLADLDIALNWYESLRRLRLNYDVRMLARDHDAYDILSKRRNSSRRLQNAQLKVINASITSNSINPYLAVLNLVLRLLKGGRHVLLVDTHSVWIRDPLPLFWEKYDTCDMLVLPDKNRAASSSFAFIKSSAKTISLINSCREKIDTKAEATGDGIATLTSLLAKASGSLADNTNDCEINEHHIPSEESVFGTDGWYHAHSDKIYAVRIAATRDLKRKRDLLLQNHLWFLRQKI